MVHFAAIGTNHRQVLLFSVASVLLCVLCVSVLNSQRSVQ